MLYINLISFPSNSYHLCISHFISFLLFSFTSFYIPQFSSFNPMDALNALRLAVEVMKWKCTRTRFARRICFLWNLKKNMDILRANNEYLIVVEDDIRREINIRREIRPYGFIPNLVNIETVKGRVNDITRSFEENHTCFFTCSRLKLAERVIEVIRELDMLLLFADEQQVAQLSMDRLNLKKNMDILRVKNEYLIAVEDDIRQEIRRDGFIPTDLFNIETVKGRVNDITRSFEENHTCFLTCSRLKLAERVIEVIRELDMLLQFADEQQVAQLSSLTTNRLNARGRVVEVVKIAFSSVTRRITYLWKLQENMDTLEDEVLVAPTLVGDAMVKRNLDAVLGSLRDPLIGKVGIYAMCGSGKTATMKNIHNQLLNTQYFDKIIWITVSKYLNLHRVQRHIAEQLRLDLSMYAHEDQRAARLFHKLRQTNKLLIVLDDVWSPIPLKKIGIPEPNMENKCKIVLTTRSLVVCRDMKTDLNIKLELLSNEETWNLFVSKARNQNLYSELQPLDKELVQECGGLPLAIHTVARALRKEANIKAWRKFVQDLWNSPLHTKSMEYEVFVSMYFSYNHLRTDTMRKCFLYCAMFPKDYRIGRYEMVTLWMAENYIKEKGNLETQTEEGYKIWKELLDDCMINEDGTMQYCLRYLAIDIMKEGHRWLCEAGLQLTELPSYIKWREIKKISLMRNEIHSLPDRLICPELSTLLLRHNPLSQPLHFLFFSQMPALQVLDLSYTGITELPSSFSDLLNLRALFLQHCGALEKIPSVAKLQKLWMVDLSYTSIKQVPQGLEELSSLTSLSLSGCKSLEKIPSLVKLEKLQQFD